MACVVELFWKTLVLFYVLVDFAPTQVTDEIPFPVFFSF